MSIIIGREIYVGKTFEGLVSTSLETRQRRGKTEARVQWAGYPIAQSTWEDRVLGFLR